jgi:DNA-binding CsgD family transcriptional regulator/PAS domain-containing protein
MPDSSRLRDFSNVVGRIYDASVDPTVWPEVLGILCTLFDSVAGALNYHELLGQRALLAVEFGTDKYYSQLYVERYSLMNPIIPGCFCYEVGAVIRIRDVVNLSEYEESQFYKEWVEPQGYGDVMGAVIQRDERHLGAITLIRRAADGPYEDADVEAFKLIGEHVRRAVQINDLFEHRQIAVTMFETLLSGLATAVILIDDGGRVLFVNEAGKRLLHNSRVGRIVGGRLFLSSISVADLIRSVANHQGYVAALPQTTGAETPFGLTAFALRGDVGRKYGVPVAIFISGQHTAPKPPPALLAEMYELTGGELRVLLALLEGKSPDAIAAQFGISVTTVRTHLTRLFAKTGSTGQVDLMHKVAAVIPPVCIPETGV